jgi:predicted glutamine amidotransferase
MCRWTACSGDPILAEELLFKPQHSIIDQSLHSRLGATTTNGVGIGWYGESVEGFNDSVTLFVLALTFGRTDDHFEAVSRAIGFVESWP